ncbi:MAG: hypothetical protein Q4G25_10865 [Paracoccus sp. (in: a-proteobacteria)]|nr:hypothetical protein [Paracoccus sp. (in: a-proteobacteria)]
MQRLFLLLLSISMATLAGIGVVIVLAMGLYGTWPIVLAAAAGALLALPVSWLVARRISENDIELEE